MLEHPKDNGDGEITDAELCDAVRNGEAWPFAVLWERHYRPALNWARTKDAANAEDVVSDAFDAVYRALLRGGGPTDAFRSYLFRTINSGFSRVWTEAQRSVGIDDFDAPDERIASAETLFSETEEQAAAAAALEDLPLRWKRVILEVDVGGRPVQEVAEELELSPNSTTVLLKRAREGLKKSWLKRMHPNGGLSGDCAACVAQFSELRWGKRNGSGRGKAKEHLEGCPGCRSRWSRFAEQATVVGMVSTSVIAMNRNWKRKAAVAAVAGVATVGLVAVAVGVALPTLTRLPETLPGPTPGASEGISGGEKEVLPKGGSGAGGASSRGSNSQSQGGSAASGDRPAPNNGMFLGEAGNESTQPPDGEGAAGSAQGFEIPNSAHVNVNDLDLDGDGTPGAPTNEVWSRWGVAFAQKVDVVEPDQGIAGAKFRLWASDLSDGCLDNADLTLVSAPDGAEFVAESGPGGVIELPPLWVGDDEASGGAYQSGLSQRCYVLKEIAAPKGYVLPEEGERRTEIIAKVAPEPAERSTVLIPNRKSAWYALSNTGAGSQLLMVGGGALVVSAVGIVLLARGSKRPKA